MDHVAIDLGGRESQICIRRPNNDVHLERRIPTAKLKAFFKTLEPSRVRGWMRGQILTVGSGGTATFPTRVRAYFEETKAELPPCIERQLTAIDGLTEQVKACDDELNLIAAQNDDCVRVMTVPGVGPATAVRFVAALDGVVRFRTAHEVESYFGLTPGEHSSSDTKRRTGLTKAGSAAVRWLLVQTAWTALRTRPNGPMVLWARRMTERKKNRFVAVVALARKIAGVMYALRATRPSIRPIVLRQRARTTRRRSSLRARRSRRWRAEVAPSSRNTRVWPSGRFAVGYRGASN